MKLIFECETELGQCDPDRINGHFGEDVDEWLAFAHTTAALTGPRGLLRIEQRCYLRSSQRLGEIRSQNCVRPEMTLEPLLGSKEETLETVQQMHQQFAQKAQAEFLQESVVTVPSSIASSSSDAQGRIGGIGARAIRPLASAQCK